MLKRAVIFDLDGTLLDTLQDLAAAADAALAERGYATHTLAEYRFLVGNGATRLLADAVGDPALAPEELQALRAGFDRYYRTHLHVYTRPYPGILALLQELQRRSVELAVFTNKPHEAATQLVEHCFPDIRFAAVCGQKPGVPLKPDPTVLLDIMHQMGVTAEEALYVGDSDVDMYTGRNAGVRHVGVSWGFRPKKELLDAGADVIIDEVDQLYDEIAR